VLLLLLLMLMGVVGSGSIVRVAFAGITHFLPYE
jgi:hypothetical protein